MMPRGTGRFFISRRFLLFFVSQSLVSCGAFIQVVAVGQRLVGITNSGLLTGLSMVCAPLPGVLLSLIAGGIGDRAKARNLLLLFDLLRGGLLLLYPFCSSASGAPARHDALGRSGRPVQPVQKQDADVARRPGRAPPREFADERGLRHRQSRHAGAHRRRDRARRKQNHIFRLRHVLFPFSSDAVGPRRPGRAAGHGRTAASAISSAAYSTPFPAPRSGVRYSPWRSTILERYRLISPFTPLPSTRSR